MHPFQIQLSRIKNKVFRKQILNTEETGQPFWSPPPATVTKREPLVSTGGGEGGSHGQPLKLGTNPQADASTIFIVIISPLLLTFESQ